MENAIEIRGLSKHYKDFSLNAIDLEVPKGCIVGFIGDNGAGKTTTLRLILNLAHPDDGEIRVFNLHHIKDQKAIKQQLGVVFDECNFHETLKAPDVGTILRQFYVNWDNDLFQSYLTRLGLPSNKTIKEYSRGMKMKLSIAAALAHHPKLLLLDEATGGLDPIVRNEILDIFREFIQDEERAILISSHITSDLEKVCDYIYFIHQGEILLHGPKDNLLDTYGILRCKNEELAAMRDLNPLRVRKNSFGCEMLITDRQIAQKRHPEVIVDRLTLEDIMLFFIKGEVA